MLTAINEVTAIIAGLSFALVLKGLLPGVKEPMNTAVEYLSRGIFVIGGAIFARFLYWDVIHEIIRNFFPESLNTSRYVGTSLNSVWNLLLILGAWFVLRALLERVPEEDRKKWNVLTVAFYPRGFWGGK